jgi:hypothetical protein
MAAVIREVRPKKEETRRVTGFTLENYFDDDLQRAKGNEEDDDYNDEEEADNSSVRAIFGRFQVTHQRVLQTIEQYKPMDEIKPIAIATAPQISSPASGDLKTKNPAAAASKSIASTRVLEPASLGIIPDDRVIVEASQSETVRAVLGYMFEKKLLMFQETVKVGLRLASLLGPGALLWGDIRKPKVDDKAPYENISRVSLTILVKCGVSITDLRQAGVASTWADLKQRFAFHPAALMLNYGKLNLSRLKSLYKIDWVEMALDFQVGIYDYLINFGLSLQDLNMFGLNMDIALNWRTKLDEAYVTHGYPSPLRDAQGYSHLQSNLLRDLDKKVFLLRLQKMSKAGVLEMPDDWVMFFAMTGEHLVTLGMTKRELLSVWGGHYKGLPEILHAFGCSEEQSQAIFDT